MKQATGYANFQKTKVGTRNAKKEKRIMIDNNGGRLTITEHHHEI